MGLFDKIKTALNDIPQAGKVKVKKSNNKTKKPDAPPTSKPKKPRAKKNTGPKLDLNNPKDLATSKGEPWVTVLGMELDKENPGQGAFELDWNDIFVARLIKSGYQGKTDQDIVDNWFQDVCRNVVMETYQQEQADPSNRTNRRDLGNGRTEIS